MISQKSIQTKKVYCLICSMLVIVLLAGVTGSCKASEDKKPSLWRYNDKKVEKPIDLQGIPDYLIEVQNALSSLQSQLVPFLQRCKSLTKTNPELQKTLDSLTKDYETRQKRMEELEKQIAELEAAFKSRSKKNTDNKQSTEELETRLKEVKKKYDGLVEQKAKLLEDSIKCKEQQGRSINKPAPEDMNIVHAMIYNNCFVPVCEPYYKFESVLQMYYGQIVRTTRVERVKDGEPIYDAVKPGGYLDSFLSKIDPNKEYAMFLVCPDSVSAFRIAAEKAKERGIQYAWGPIEDVPLTTGGDQPWINK